MVRRNVVWGHLGTPKSGKAFYFATPPARRSFYGGGGLGLLGLVADGGNQRYEKGGSPARSRSANMIAIWSVTGSPERV